MKKSTKKNKKGFTLIELLIVVAIIAILAAIAIPQFSQYRIKGYNAAGSSDLRNARTAEEALFADFQSYGDTGAAVDSADPATLTTTDTSSVVRTLSLGLSNGVSIFSKTNAATGAAGLNYLVFTKHTQGDRIFGADNNVTTIYWYQQGVGVLTTGMPGPSYTSTAVPDITPAGWTSL